MSVELIAGRKTGLRHAGEGALALLLHCSLAHSGAWSGVMAALSGRPKMVAVDLPGHGRTDYDPALPVQAQAIETAVALLEKMDKPAHIIGHSFGATVALHLAIERPDLVASLALYEPVYFSILASGDAPAFTAEQAVMAPFEALVKVDDWVGAANLFLARWGGGMRFQDVPEAQQTLILNVLPFLVAPDIPISRPESGDAVLAKLPAIVAPCLLIEGGRSPEVISKINDVLQCMVPNCQRSVLETAAHMGPITHANEVAQVIEASLFGYGR